MQNTVYLHAFATNIGNGNVCLYVNVSTSGNGESNALSCFKTAARNHFLKEIDQPFAPATRDIRLLASRPVSDSQRLINAVKKYGKTKRAGVSTVVLRKNRYNFSDSKIKGHVCPDALRQIRTLVANTKAAA